MAETTQNTRQIVQAPQAGQDLVVKAVPGQDIVLVAAFDQAEAKVDGSNVVFEFANGGQVVIDFSEIGDAQAPNIVMSDGTVLSVQEFLASLGEGDVEPAAGPDGGATGSGGVGSYEDDAGDIIGGVDKLGVLNPRDFSSITVEGLEARDAVAEEPTLSSPPSISAPGGIVNEAGLENGTISETDAEFLTGSFTISDPDGLGDITSLSINGATIPISGLVGSVVSTSLGILTITGFDAGTGVVSYSYQLAAQQDHSGGDVADSFLVSVNDASGASASATITISVLDDQPTASIVINAEASVVLDESIGQDETDPNAALDDGVTPNPFSAAFGTPIGLVSGVPVVSSDLSKFGADTSGATKVVTLNVDGGEGVDSGLKTTAGETINLWLEDDGTVTGRVGGEAGTVVFAVTINNAGNLSVAQYGSLLHGDAGSFDESVTLAGKLIAVVTVTDGDGDVATGQVSIGALIEFQDDGPSLTLADTQLPSLVLDESQMNQSDGIHTVSADFAGSFDVIYGTDGPGYTDYALSLRGENLGSGMFALGENGEQGEEIMLSLDGADIVGSIGEDAFFRITVDTETGRVTFVQYENVWHSNPDNPDDASWLDATTGTIVLTATVTDGDGDTASATLDLSAGVFAIEDDGPSATLADAPLPTLVLDESAIGQGDGSGVVESPQDTANFNIATAISLDGHFTLGTNPDVANSETTPYTSVHAAGNNAFDYFSFTVTEAGSVGVFDVDYAMYGFDSTLRLYDANGTLLAEVDDYDQSAGAGGSVHPYDAFLSYTFSQAGTYYIQVGQYWTNPVPNGGTYQLQVSLTNAITGSGDGIRTISADFAGSFDVIYGADGPGDTDYALSLQGENLGSGMFALGENGGQGEEIMLSLDGADIVGSIGDVTFFRIMADTETGRVTFVQYENVWHSNPDSPDDASWLGATAGTIVLTATVTDGDGDISSATLDLSAGVFAIEDDGPTAAVGQESGGQETPLGVGVDESAGLDDGTDPVSLGTASAVVVNSNGSAYGADEEGGTTEFGLSISADGADSGLQTTDGTSILLYDNDGVIEGRAGDVVAFSLGIDSATGEVTLTQFLSLYHPDDTDHDDFVNLAEGVISAVVTVTDGDGDVATDTVDIGGLFTFYDDGPTAAVGLEYGEDQETPVGVAVDESAGSDDGTDPVSLGTASAFVVNSNGSAYGADEEGGTTEFGLSLFADGADSGLQTTDGTSILLYNNDGVIEGRAGDVVAFSLGIDSATGEVTLTQFLSLYHPDDTDHDDFVNLAEGVISAVVTVTDGDGDVATDTVDIGGLFTFYDDGPTAAVGLEYGEDQETPVGVAVDESAGSDDGTDPVSLGTASAFVVNSNGSAYGADEEGGTTEFGLSISADGADSGLQTTDGTSILLYNNDGVIEGRAGNVVAFSLGIDSATGEVTLTQFLSLSHPDDENPNDFVNLAEGVISAVVTVTDGDGDVATDTVDIGGLFTFYDDGPSVSVELSGTGAVLTDETTDLGNPISATGVVVNITALTGQDNEGATTNVALVINGPASGLMTTEGKAITLVAGTTDNEVVGRYDSDGDTILDADAFKVSISDAGVLSVTQYVSLQHPDSPDNYDEPVNLAGKLSVRATVTDGDGDVATGSQDIGNLITFKDDGPVSLDPDGMVFENQTGTHEVVGNLDFDPGADGLGTVHFTFTEGDPALDADGNHLSFNGQPLYLYYGDNDDTSLLIAKTESGTPAFQIDIDPVANTYTLTTYGLINNGTEVRATDLSGVGGGNVTWKALEDIGNTDQDVMMSTSVGTSVNTNSTQIGIGTQQSFEAGEGIRFDFVNGLNVEGKGSNVTFNYDDHNETNAFRQVVDFAQGLANISVKAIVADGDNIFYGDASDETLLDLSVSNVKVYKADGTLAVQGSDYTAVDNGNAISINGLQQGWTYEVSTGDDKFSAIQVDAEVGTANFKLGLFSYGETGSGVPVQLLYPLVGIDGDGDLIEGSVQITSENVPPQVDDFDVRLSEEGLADGNIDDVGNHDTTDLASAFGNLGIIDVDSTSFRVSMGVAAGTTLYTSEGVFVSWSGGNYDTNLGATKDLVGFANGKEVIRIHMESDGSYVVNLSEAVRHAEDTGEGESSFNVDVSVSDGFATSVSVMTVTIEDDSPIAQDVEHVISLGVDTVNVNSLSAGFINDEYLNNQNTVTRESVDPDLYNDRLRWGDPASSYGKSGYNLVDNNDALNGSDGDFTSAAGVNVKVGETFLLGEFTHVNQTIYSGSSTLKSTDVQWKMNVVINGEQREVTFAVNLEHTETTNVNGDPIASRDIVKIIGNQVTTVEIDGLAYEISLLGFRDADNQLVTTVYTDENSSTNTFGIFAVINSADEPDFSVSGSVAGFAGADGFGSVLWTDDVSEYGEFTGHSDGTYSFTMNEYGRDLLAAGESLADQSFEYTLFDKDGDSSTAHVTINFNASFAGDDDLAGGTGHDVVYGGAGEDTLFGDAGDDVLYGGTGDDLLVGGPGGDTMTGGLGSDTFAYGLDDLDGSQHEHITDFQYGAGGDVLDLSGLFDGLNMTASELEATEHLNIAILDADTLSVTIDKDGAVGGTDNVTIEIDLSGGTLDPDSTIIDTMLDNNIKTEMP